MFVLLCLHIQLQVSNLKKKTGVQDKKNFLAFVQGVDVYNMLLKSNFKT